MLTGSEHPSLILRSPVEPVIGSDLQHVAQPVMKIQRQADSVVIERPPHTAKDLVAAGGYTFVAAATPSIVDQLQAKSPAELRTLLTGAGRVLQPNESVGGMVAALLPLVEAGTVSLT